jgi:hypothetical protein
MNRDAPRLPGTDAVAHDANDELLPDMLRLFGDAQPTSTDERRSRDRFPIVYTLQLTPIDDDGNMLLGETTPIEGKDLSVCGFSFAHMSPLRHCRAIISFTPPRVGPLAVEAEIIWTRQTPIGLYESGCRLIRRLSNPPRGTA